MAVRWSGALQLRTPRLVGKQAGDKLWEARVTEYVDK
jgi:hypothetical protein